MGRKTKKVLGYDVDLLSFDDVVETIVDNMKNRVGMHVVTINPEMIENARKNYEFNKILKKADMVVPDGVGIILALKFKKVIQEQVRGVELAKELIRECESYGLSVALIGSKESVLERTVERLLNEHKLLRIVYSRNGFFTRNSEENIINDLQRANPQLALIALGSPKQELFISRCRKNLPNTVFIGVGGTFDVWAGEVERAPEFYQKIGMEWLYRTIKQPERFKRIYKTIPAFLIKSFIDGIKNRNK